LVEQLWPLTLPQRHEQIQGAKNFLNLLTRGHKKSASVSHEKIKHLGRTEPHLRRVMARVHPKLLTLPHGHTKDLPEFLGVIFGRVPDSSFSFLDRLLQEMGVPFSNFPHPIFRGCLFSLRVLFKTTNQMRRPAFGERAHMLVTRTPKTVELALRCWLVGPVHDAEAWLKRIQPQWFLADRISDICG
jgi:hypothetical protein